MLADTNSAALLCTWSLLAIAVAVCDYAAVGASRLAVCAVGMVLALSLNALVFASPLTVGTGSGASPLEFPQL